MPQDTVPERTQEQGIQEKMQAMMIGYFEQQKASTLERYRMLNQYARKGQILFVGSSLMEWFPINEMQQDLNIDHVIYNRGIGATTTDNLLATMNVCIFDLQPSKVFINISSNDIGSPGYKKESLLSNYGKIIDQIKEKLPGCRVLVMAYYPVNPKADFGLDKSMKESMFATRTNQNITEANKAVEELAKEYGVEFINVNEGLTDEAGNLKAELSVEGLHLWPNAYKIILENMRKYLQ